MQIAVPHRLHNLCARLCRHALAAWLVGTAAAASAADCDGFPRIAATTAPGTCLGLVARRLGSPRGVAIAGTDIWIADLADWVPGRGRLLKLGQRGRAPPVVVATGLDRPNSIVADADGVLVAEAAQISRIEPDGRRTALAEGLPADGLHPLKSLLPLPDGRLVVGIGSASNNCEGEGDGTAPPAPCPELAGVMPRASVIVLHHGQPATILARGLRNPSALARLPDGRLLAAVNARDAISGADIRLDDRQLPHDLLVVLNDGDDFGWPYCWDRRRTAPEYRRHDCRRATLPWRLLPAHGAPLALLPYTGTLASLNGMLLVALHGHRATGHRVVALDPARPAASVRDIVRLSGFAPAGLALMADGSVLISDDRAGRLYRLAASN